MHGVKAGMGCHCRSAVGMGRPSVDRPRVHVHKKTGALQVVLPVARSTAHALRRGGRLQLYSTTLTPESYAGFLSP